MDRESQAHKNVSKNTKDTREKAILIGIEFLSNGSSPLNNNLKELNRLTETARYNVISDRLFDCNNYYASQNNFVVLDIQ